MTSSMTRVCIKCNEEKLKTRDFFYYSRKSLNQLRTICIECDKGVSSVSAVCLENSCENFSYARGLCKKCYQIHKRNNTLDNFPIKNFPLREICSVENCNRKHIAVGLCSTHYRRLRTDGYIDPKKPIKDRNPGITTSFNKSNGYMYVRYENKSYLEHRKIYEDFLGRKLNSNENIHHINGDRTDNRLENLELWNTSQPAGQRIEDKVQWAVELLTIYSPEKLI